MIESAGEIAEIAAYLKGLRAERGLSARLVADEAGIGRTTLHRWETGESKPRLPELDATLQALNATDAERARAHALIDAPRFRQQTDEATLFDMTLPHRGDLIRALRVRRGWTQSVAAANLGVRQPTIAHWEAMETVPSAEAIARLCAVLQAYPEEQEALQSPHLLPPAWSAKIDIATCEAQVSAYGLSVQTCDSPLAELHALVLKRQLLRLAREANKREDSEEAIRLLSITETAYSWHLQMQQRHRQAYQVTWDALHLAQGSYRPEYHWTEALNVASLYAAKGRSNGRGQINLLLQWLPWFPQGVLRMRIECDIAYYASNIPGNEEEALHRLAIAHATLQSYTPTDETDEDYFRLTYCRALARVGHPLEAARDFPVARTLTAENAMRLTQWAEVILIAGEKNEASRLLGDIQTILARFPLPTIRVLIDSIGKQL